MKAIDLSFVDQNMMTFAQREGAEAMLPPIRPLSLHPAGLV
jgi:hypothetical protein